MMRDSTTRHLLVLGGHELHVPDYVFEEVEKHLGELSARSGLSGETLREVLQTLRAHLLEHDLDEYRQFLRAATRRLEGRDLKDVPYFAVALAVGADGVWSEDQGLESSEGMPVYRTADLVRLAP